MNRITIKLKKRIHFTILIVSIGLSCLNTIAQTAGTGTCKVLKQPCNEYDGILVTTITSGLTPPLTFQYSGGAGIYSAAVIHSNVNALSDTLFGTQGCNYVYVYDNARNSVSITNTGMISPFTIDYPTVTPAVCPSTTGTAKITINSGAMPDTVRWYTNVGGVPVTLAGEGNPMNLQVGKYIALVCAKGCRFYFNSGKGQDTTPVNGGLSITASSNIKYTVTTTNANCKNGTAKITAITGGKEPYSYHWANGALTANISNLSMGSYPVTVTDAEGCYSVSYAYVNQSKTITVNSTITKPTCLQNDGSVISFGSGGVSPYTYLYSNGVNTQTACCLTGGTYVFVTVTDVNGCIGQGYASIVSATPITVTYSTKPSSCTSPTGSATLAIAGGTSPYSVTWNTYPVQTGVTVNNMSAGNVSFKVTDSKGCVQTGTVVIPPISTINASIDVNNPICPAKTGTLRVNATGTNPPYSYLWNTGDKGQYISTAPIGSYNCVITDNLGCSVIKYKNVQSVSTVKIDLIPKQTSCIFRTDGSISTNVYGGKAPYTYKWSNGQTTDKATGLGKGVYYVYVADSNGCAKDNHTTVGYDATNDSCYCTLKGKVYLDENSNCQLDGQEKGIEHIMIHCARFGYTYTNANGDYAIQVPTGTYALSEAVQSVYPLAICQNNSDTVTVTAGHGCFSTFDFANTLTPLHDIRIITANENQPVRGYPYTQSVIIQNDGTVTEPNIDVVYQHDGQLQYNSTMPSVYSQPDPVGKPNLYLSNNTFPSLAPGASIKLLTNYLVPANVPLGTMINFKDTAVYKAPTSNWLTDYSPWNNVNSFETPVLGSYDPNFLEVLPQGKGPNCFIHNTDSVLTYTIHFQNTGNYFAENIYLVDTLDKNLEIESLKPGYSDYNYTADVSEDGVLKFTFNNIHLNWQAQNELTSNGMVTFSIKHKPNLAHGTQIKNTTDIYFDFNSAVPTNSTLSTINNNIIKGKLTYDDTKHTILPHVSLFLKNAENKVIDSTKTDISGNYIFNYMPDGNYTIGIKSTQIWGGITPIDALITNRNYIHIYEFTDELLKQAADVNTDNHVTPVDALMINRRYIKVIDSFKSADWLSTKDVINVNNGTVIKDLKSVCAGDVNGSYFSK